MTRLEFIRSIIHYWHACIENRLRLVVSILLVQYCAALHGGSAEGLSARIDWRSQRDDSIDKQRFDYSCGASSLATIIKYFHGVDASESEILQVMPDLDRDLAASFLEISRAAENFGFRSRGFEVDFDQLLRMKIPAIAHVRYEGRDHFTVIRGVSKQYGSVWLADPSWGNLVLSRYQFLKLWDFSNNGKGRLLLIFRSDYEVDSGEKFFGEPQDWLSYVKDEWMRRRPASAP